MPGYHKTSELNKEKILKASKDVFNIYTTDEEPA